MRSITRREEPTIIMMMKFELIAKYSCIYESLKFIFTKMSIILEMQNTLAANISRFTVHYLYDVECLWYLGTTNITRCLRLSVSRGKGGREHFEFMRRLKIVGIILVHTYMHTYIHTYIHATFTQIAVMDVKCGDRPHLL